MNKTTNRALPPSVLIEAIERLLQPLVRLLIQFGITYPLLSRMLKTSYVKVADEEMRISSKRQTDSRITLLTGVHRKDVKRLRQTHKDMIQAPPSVSIGAALIAHWTGEPAYLGEDGHPRPLLRLSKGGEGPTFESLVRSVSKDIRPRSVLDEWLRTGIVHINERDHVCLDMEVFIPEHGFDEKAYYLGRNLHDHIAACGYNVCEGDRKPMLERSTYYDGLTPDDVAQLCKLSEELGMKALLEVNRKALELQGNSTGDSEARQRINFGIYCYHEKMDTSEDKEH